MGSERMRRVDEAIRQVIADALAGRLKDPRVGFVTITDVRTSPDLSRARVYVSVLDGGEGHEATLEGLSSAHGYLQHQISSQLRLRRTPMLSFYYDDTTDRAMRIEGLLAARVGAAGREAGAAASEPARGSQEEPPEPEGPHEPASGP